MSTHFEIDIAKLSLSTRYQARKTPGQVPLTELAESIAAQGMLQNLVATKGKKRGTFEVIAGGRRLQAIQSLIEQGRWAKEAKVWVTLVENDQALEASITENVQREAMHPADEFEAFAALVEQGHGIEDIAARFGVSPAVVRRRLKLANVAPELLQAYRDDELPLEALMAFTVSDDKDLQLQVWESLNDWDRKNAHAIRRRLTQGAVTAASPVAQFVGLEAYNAAGGRSHQDLFAQDDERGVYLQDVALLDQLAIEKLQTIAADIEQEGWSWVEVKSAHDSAWSSFGRVHPEQGGLTQEQETMIEAIDQRLQAIEQELEALGDEDEDHEKWRQLGQEGDELEAARESIEIENEVWTDSAKAIAGAVIYLTNSAQVHIDRGLIRPQDRQRANQVAKEQGDSANLGSLPVPKTRPIHSERLVRQLSAHKVGIVAADLATKPTIALAVLVAQLARSVFGTGYFAYGGFGLGISLKHEDLRGNAPDFKDSKAAKAMDEQRTRWLAILPTDERGELSVDVLTWALAQNTETLLELLAYCVAGTVQGIAFQEKTHPTDLDRLAQITGVDPSQWWTATTDSYLGHVNKEQLVSVVTEVLGADSALPLVKMKKAEAAEHVQQLLADKPWVPTTLRIKATTNQ